MRILAILLTIALSFSAFSMERTISTEQRMVRTISTKISSAGVVSGLDKYRVSATLTGTGTYDITFNKGFSRDVTAYVNNVATACNVKSITETLAKVTVVMAAADAATEKACAFNLLVIGSDTTEAY